MVDTVGLNPFTKFNIGLGDVGNMAILIVIITLVFGGIGFLIWWKLEQKKYLYKIPLYRYYEGVAYKVRDAPFLAKAIPISKAGDTLWYVKGAKRWIEPAIYSDGINSFPHYWTKDDEWINFAITSVDDERKKAGLSFTHQDMKVSKVGIGELLEQRLINKSFWDKYKDILVNIIFFFITAIAMVVIFWQWGGIVESTGQLIENVNRIAEQMNNLQCVQSSPATLVPSEVLP